MRAGTETMVRRMVPVVAFVNRGSAVRVAAARVRPKAITAQTSRAALAVNRLDGRSASAELRRSAWTCSMMAWWRWSLSAATVSRSVVVKKAWNPLCQD